MLCAHGGCMYSSRFACTVHSWPDGRRKVPLRGAVVRLPHQIGPQEEGATATACTAVRQAAVVRRNVWRCHAVYGYERSADGT